MRPIALAHSEAATPHWVPRKKIGELAHIPGEDGPPIIGTTCRVGHGQLTVLDDRLERAGGFLIVTGPVWAALNSYSGCRSQTGVTVRNGFRFALLALLPKTEITSLRNLRTS